MPKFYSFLDHFRISIEVLPGDIADWVPPTDVIGPSLSTPNSEFPFLYRDGNLGIPKKVLYRLYMDAIALFAASPTTQVIRQASSSIILLANPAHTSVLNARKTLIQSGHMLPDQELAFTEILLQASFDCAKQSILWDHRRWLFRLLHPPIQPSLAHVPPDPARKWISAEGLQSLPCIPLKDIKKEFGIIRGACEMYPRNYHAWSHWQFIVDAVYGVLSTYKDHPQHLNVLADEFITLHHWVNRHVSDHTAIHHLCNFSQLFYDLDGQYPLHLINRFSGIPPLNSLLAEQALTLATSYPTHESLWMYLRRVIAVLHPQERQTLIDSVESSTVCQSAMARRFLVWIEVQTFK